MTIRKEIENNVQNEPEVRSFFNIVSKSGHVLKEHTKKIFEKYLLKVMNFSRKLKTSEGLLIPNKKNADKLIERLKTSQQETIENKVKKIKPFF